MRALSYVVACALVMTSTQIRKDIFAGGDNVLVKN